MIIKDKKSFNGAKKTLILFVFILTAFILRLPSFMHSVIDHDESLYLIIANNLLNGHLPGTNLFDYKPFFLFSIFAIFQEIFSNDILGIRILGVVCVGVSSFFLFLIFGKLFQKVGHGGIIAGFFYIVLTVANGGLATNAEIVLHPFLLGGTWLILKAFRKKEAGSAGGMYCLGAGFLLGLGYQVKPIIIFDIVGLFILLFLMEVSRAAKVGVGLIETLKKGGISFGGFWIPLGVSILIYVISGNFNAWLNMYKYGVEGAWYPFEIWRIKYIFIGLSPYGILIPLILLALGRQNISSDRAERAKIAGVIIWGGVSLIGIKIAGFYYNHHFILLAPSLCLAAAYGMNFAVESVGAKAGSVRVAAILSISAIILGILVNPQAYIEAGTVYIKRHQTGDELYGDLPRKVAAELRGQIKPGAPIYIYGYHCILYYLMGAGIPNRFPFSDHIGEKRSAGILSAIGFDPIAEIDSALSKRPKFIIISDEIYYDNLEVTARVRYYLERDYRVYKMLKPDRILMTAYAGARGGAIIYKRKK